MRQVWQEATDHSVWLYFRLRYPSNWRYYWLNYETTGEVLW